MLASCMIRLAVQKTDFRRLLWTGWSLGIYEAKRSVRVQTTQIIPRSSSLPPTRRFRLANPPLLRTLRHSALILVSLQSMRVQIGKAHENPYFSLRACDYLFVGCLSIVISEHGQGHEEFDDNPTCGKGVQVATTNPIMSRSACGPDARTTNVLPYLCHEASLSERQIKARAAYNSRQEMGDPGLPCCSIPCKASKRVTVGTW